MVKFAWLFAVALVVCAPAGRAQTLQADVRDVISSQIEAFQTDDFATAFTFASPELRRIFRTPERFGRMVMKGYPMVWRPSDLRYGDLVERDGRTYQRLFLRDRSGAGFVATYEMRKTRDGWRINGVWIEPAPGAGA